MRFFCFRVWAVTPSFLVDVGDRRGNSTPRNPGKVLGLITAKLFQKWWLPTCSTCIYMSVIKRTTAGAACLQRTHNAKTLNQVNDWKTHWMPCFKTYIGLVNTSKAVTASFSTGHALVHPKNQILRLLQITHISEQLQKCRAMHTRQRQKCACSTGKVVGSKLRKILSSPFEPVSRVWYWW